MDSHKINMDYTETILVSCHIHIPKVPYIALSRESTTNNLLNMLKVCCSDRLTFFMDSTPSRNLLVVVREFIHFKQYSS